MAKGMDSEPAASLHGLHALWGLQCGNGDDCDAAASDRRLEEQLFTFAACADLKRTLRARAVVCRDSHARLRMAEAALQQQRARLRASLALERAVCKTRERLDLD